MNIKSIPLSSKQQAAAREFAVAIESLQQRQRAYLKAILDAQDVAADSNWRLTPDGAALELVEPPPAA